MIARLSIAIFAAVMATATAADPATPDEIAKVALAPLLDPAKVKTLKGDRPANPRLYKVLYWLEAARRAGGNQNTVIDTAQAATGYAGTKGAAADKLAILWSARRLEEFGCFDAAGMAELRKGNSPTITKGEHAGDSIALDHVLLRAIVPELAARFYNLEAIPSKLNGKKSAKITDREVKLAQRWNREGLLSAAGLAAVVKAGERVTNQPAISR